MGVRREGWEVRRETRCNRERVRGEMRAERREKETGRNEVKVNRWSRGRSIGRSRGSLKLCKRRNLYSS